MSDKRYIKLSKKMSYFLRHHPDEAGLVLDEEGMVPIATFIRAINKQRGFGWVTERDLEILESTSDKKRFRIEGGRIGARYGHNRDIRQIKHGDPIDPPDLLYHGTPRRVVSSIMKQGLLPQGRQFVHLSVDLQTAEKVGRRRDGRPLILTIRARDAQAAGIDFYSPTPDTYLARKIPPEFIDMKK